MATSVCPSRIEARHVLGHALRHALVGGARLVDVLDLQVGIRRGQRVEHAPASLLHVEVQTGEQIEAAHEAVVQLV
jgi:hypothetical protein